MNPRAFHHRLASTLPSCIRANHSILCAVSGGIDSVVMLHALHAISRKKALVLRVGHVDHGIRADSADVAGWVERLAERLGLMFVSMRVSAPAMVRRGGVSLEEAARKARYAALKQMAQDSAAECVVVAHHADDQAETVLHHILRGTGLAGLSGMPAERSIVDGSAVTLVRPMLGFTRAEIEAYAASEELDYCEDSTNQDTSLTRNRIRRQLLPMLREQFNLRVVEALVRLAHHAREAAEVVGENARELITLAASNNRQGVSRFEVSILKEALPGTRREALREVLKSMGAPMQSLDLERLAAVDGLTQGDGRRRTVELPGRFAAQRRGKFLLIGKASAIVSPGADAKSARKKPKRAGRVSR